MKEPIAARPLSEKRKSVVFNQISDKEAEKVMLAAYVDSFLEDNGLTDHVILEVTKTRVIASIVFAVVLALETTYMMLYHSFSILVFFGVCVAEFLIYLAFIRNRNLSNYLQKEIIRRPDDNMDNILISQVSGATSRSAARILYLSPLAAAVLVLLLVFMKPHMIFEKNEMGGYSVRYYTMALISEDHVVVPETHNGLPVNEIRGNVFQNLGFTTIDLPSGLTVIRASTFENCGNLVSIDIPDGVTRIAAHAFCDCSSLREATIPPTVNEIGSSAFRRCSSLRTVRISRNAVVNSKAFKESPTQITYY